MSSAPDFDRRVSATRLRALRAARQRSQRRLRREHDPADIDGLREAGLLICSCADPIRRRVFYGQALQCDACGRPIIEAR